MSSNTMHSPFFFEPELTPFEKTQARTASVAKTAVAKAKAAAMDRFSAYVHAGGPTEVKERLAYVSADLVATVKEFTAPTPGVLREIRAALKTAVLSWEDKMALKAKVDYYARANGYGVQWADAFLNFAVERGVPELDVYDSTVDPLDSLALEFGGGNYPTQDEEGVELQNLLDSLIPVTGSSKTAAGYPGEFSGDWQKNGAYDWQKRIGEDNDFIDAEVRVATITDLDFDWNVDHFQRDANWKEYTVTSLGSGYATNADDAKAAADAVLGGRTSKTAGSWSTERDDSGDDVYRKDYDSAAVTIRNYGGDDFSVSNSEDDTTETFGSIDEAKSYADSKFASFRTAGDNPFAKKDDDEDEEQDDNALADDDNDGIADEVEEVAQAMLEWQTATDEEGEYLVAQNDDGTALAIYPYENAFYWQVFDPNDATGAVLSEGTADSPEAAQVDAEGAATGDTDEESPFDTDGDGTDEEDDNGSDDENDNPFGKKSGYENMDDTALLNAYRDHYNSDDDWFDYDGEIAADGLDRLLEEMEKRNLLSSVTANAEDMPHLHNIDHQEADQGADEENPGSYFPWSK